MPHRIASYRSELNGWTPCDLQLRGVNLFWNLSENANDEHLMQWDVASVKLLSTLWSTSRLESNGELDYREINNRFNSNWDEMEIALAIEMESVIPN